MLKEVLEYILPLITAIINKSLGNPKFRFLSNRPMLKKTNLDKGELKFFYRLVSNLSFLSKIPEKIVAKRLETQLSRDRLHDNLQSA